jgi:aerobic carbon-monoxide dehydrogenase medium subunit
MKASSFDYVKPNSLSEAISLLGQSDEAQLLAGGQSLIPMMNLRVASPAVIIDIGGLCELKTFSEDKSAISLGACITHAAIEDRRVPDPSRGLMPRVASGLSYRAVRTRGTIGGSLALADPAAEWPTVLTALGAHVTLSSNEGRRKLSVAELITGTYETQIAGEVLERIEVPKLSEGARWGYVKLSRKSGAFATSIAAVVHDPSRAFSRAVLGAANGAPIILHHTTRLVEAGRAELEALEDAISNDLVAANDRLFDNYQIETHTATITRAMHQVIK